MTKAKALAAFKRLIEFENEVTGDKEDPGFVEPGFDVRLDAGSEESRANETYGQTMRTWRIRVTFSKSGFWDISASDALRAVLEIAEQADASVSVQNNGIELA